MIYDVENFQRMQEALKRIAALKPLKLLELTPENSYGNYDDCFDDGYQQGDHDTNEYVSMIALRALGEVE